MHAEKLQQTAFMGFIESIAHSIKQKLGEIMLISSIATSSLVSETQMIRKTCIFRLPNLCQLLLASHEYGIQT